MSKFIKKPAKKVAKKETKKAAKPVKKTVEAEKPVETVEVIKKGDQEFVICPKCGWQHPYGTTRCRFCGGKIK